MIKKAVAVAFKATVTDSRKWAMLCVQIDWRTPTDTALKNSPSLSKKLTTEVQSIHYGFVLQHQPWQRLPSTLGNLWNSHICPKLKLMLI